MNGLQVIFVIGLFAAFVIFADRLLDWYLDKPKTPMSWDETDDWTAIVDALKPDIEKESGGLDYLEYYDFRRKREDHPTQENQ